MVYPRPEKPQDRYRKPAFFALVALPRINHLRAVNIVISSTPASSTIFTQSIINVLRDLRQSAMSNREFVLIDAFVQ
jgi:hypothetical protein